MELQKWELAEMAEKVRVCVERFHDDVGSLKPIKIVVIAFNNQSMLLF